MRHFVLVIMILPRQKSFLLITLLCNAPEKITESFYLGKVQIELKDGVFQPSSPLRYCSELLRTLEQSSSYLHPILCLYTDGGPNHRTTFLSVQVELVGLYRLPDLDMLVAAHTALIAVTVILWKE